MEAKWEDGIWLGQARASNESLVGTRKGVVRAFAIKRSDEAKRWDAEMIKELKGTPQRPNLEAPGIEVPIRIHVPRPEEVTEEQTFDNSRSEETARGAYLKPRDFEKYGWTKGCEGCRRLRTGGMQARPHTQECRERMEAELAREENPRCKRAENKRARVREREEEQKEGETSTSSNSGERRSEDKADKSEKKDNVNTSESQDKTSNTEQSEQEKGARVRERSESQDASSSTEHADKRTRFEAGEIPSTVQFHGKRGLTEELRVRNLRAKIAERQAEKRRVEGEQNEELAEKKRRREIEESAIVKEILSVDITEIYSPQRVTNEARRYGLKPGGGDGHYHGMGFQEPRG